MRVHTVEALQNLKIKHLQHALLNIGSKKTGTKAELAERLSTHLHQPKIPASCLPSKNGIGKPLKILSIDMGIKNLAYCVATSHFRAQTPSKEDLRPPVSIHVNEWRRVNVMDRSLDHEDTPFSVENMAPIAVKLVQEVFLPVEPSIVLIEQQRFRSGGASAVQEWTLRVNMFEAMLWAALSSAKWKEKQDLPMIASVSPSRVAAFWLPGLKPVKKADKVAVVQGWLDEEKSKRVELSLIKSLNPLREMFMGKAAKDGKLDDLSDCLLQAVTWVTWEIKRQSFANKDPEELKTYIEAI